MIVRSPLLARFKHGYSTRQGGVSTGVYASLNLGSKWGDDPAHVAENRRRFAEAGGFALGRLFVPRQVHGKHVAIVDLDSTPAEVAAVEADALVSATPGVALAVGTADCVPILVHDGHGRAAAIHAGWRGTVADVAGHAIAALRALGARPQDLIAALGPSICARCFEVGPEVAAQFHAVFDPLGVACVDDAGARPHVDLHRANRACLERAGLAADAIDDAPPCTKCEPERFFSFRRDGRPDGDGGGGIGQHLSFIATS